MFRLPHRAGVALGVALSLLAADARAERVVAVLPLVDAATAGQKLDQAAKTLLEESIRAVAGDILSPFGYTILNGDNTLQILSDNGIDPSRACEASCSLGAARELKATVFVSGTVALSEGSYSAILHVFDVVNGRQLGSVDLEGKSVRDIREAFSGKAKAFFDKVDKRAQRAAYVWRDGVAPKSFAATWVLLGVAGAAAISASLLGSAAYHCPAIDPTPAGYGVTANCQSGYATGANIAWGVAGASVVTSAILIYAWAPAWVAAPEGNKLAFAIGPGAVAMTGHF